MIRIVITGASGFVGRATVGAARAKGHRVIAIGRSADSSVAAALAEAGADAYHALDLGAPGATEALGPILEGADAVIHAAAAMAGDDATHERETLAPTRALLAAIALAPARPRLVLVSSFSVYGIAAMPENTLLTELTPLDSEPHKRDAYARAKLAQESLAERAAQADGLDVWLIRPGAIYGPGQLDTARLGFALRGRRISLGGDPTIPAVDIARVGEGLVAAAIVPKPHDKDVSGLFRSHSVVVNLTDTDMPRQSAWAEAVGVNVTSLPKGAAFKAAAVLDLLCDLAPGPCTWVPKALLPARLTARFLHLRYGTQRARDVLGLEAEVCSVERLTVYANQRNPTADAL